MGTGAENGSDEVEDAKIGRPTRGKLLEPGTKYMGKRISGECLVTRIDEREARPLATRVDLCQHSESGFEWGSSGPGPAQLALALLADALDENVAIQYWRAFQERVVQKLNHEHWILTTSEIVRESEEILLDNF